MEEKKMVIKWEIRKEENYKNDKKEGKMNKEMKEKTKVKEIIRDS